MRMLFRQRFFSWLDSYDIYDEQGDVIFTVKGVLAWGHCLKIFDAQGRELGMVKEEIFTFMPRFAMYVGDSFAGMIRKRFTLFSPRFDLDLNGWEVSGDWLQWDYDVMDGSRTVATISKQIFRMTDTYVLDVQQSDDALIVLMIALAIDAAKCSQGD